MAYAAVADGYTETGRRMDPACSHLMAKVVEGGHLDGTLQPHSLAMHAGTRWDSLLVPLQKRSPQAAHPHLLPWLWWVEQCLPWSPFRPPPLSGHLDLAGPPALPCNGYSFEINIWKNKWKILDFNIILQQFYTEKTLNSYISRKSILLHRTIDITPSATVYCLALGFVERNTISPTLPGFTSC